MKLTALFVCLGIFFDFFDGLLARKLNVASELGVQLDSLADMVTSGLVPGLVLFHLLGLAPQLSWETYNLLPYFGLLVTLASAFRLAKFNISTNQSDAFIGLPTPANALLIISLPLILEYQHSDAINVIILNPWFLIALTLVSCYLLNAPIKLIALKFKTWNFKDNASRYILIILSLVLLAIFQFAGIPLVIIAYILLSIASK
ncbi:phosphatidylserine synthase [Formosa sp. Hel1_33_131]|nr:phosphatidylserine synthase [Formosa sp. Hel1_33_131]